MDFKFILSTLLPWFALACLAYAAFVRPLIKALPTLKSFYAEADTVWSRLCALAWRSASIAWGILVAVASVATQLVDQFSAALGDPDLKQQIQDFFAGYGPTVLLGVSLVFIVARFRSIIAASKGG